MAHLTLTINPEAPRLKNSLIQKHYDRKHGKDAAGGYRWSECLRTDSRALGKQTDGDLTGGDIGSMQRGK